VLDDGWIGSRTDRGGAVPKDEKDLPSTIERSDEHAQDIYSETLESAEKTYGDGERAHRTAFAALKHSYEKVGDHWEAKDEKGPSDSGAADGGPGRHDTKGGVDANASKEHLLEVAKRLDVSGRSSMTKDELVDAIQKANAKATREAR
jgi:cation transport regulator ChaB